MGFVLARRGRYVRKIELRSTQGIMIDSTPEQVVNEGWYDGSSDGKADGYSIPSFVMDKRLICNVESILARPFDGPSLLFLSCQLTNSSQPHLPALTCTAMTPASTRTRTYPAMQCKDQPQLNPTHHFSIRWQSTSAASHDAIPSYW